MEFGGIVGRVNLDGCVRNSRSPWAADDLFHWLVSDPQPMRFEALCGRQGLFEVYFRHLPGSDRVEATTEP
jgi:hypothetical protein